MIRNITLAIAAAIVLSIATVAIAAPAPKAATPDYNGPHQGTFEAALSGDTAFYTTTGHENAEGIDVSGAYYATDQIFIDAMLGYASASHSSSTTTYGIGVGYDFVKDNNVVPYVAIGYAGESISGGGGDNDAFEGRIGVSDYFIKGRAIFLEEDGLFPTKSHSDDSYTTVVGLKLDIN